MSVSRTCRLNIHAECRMGRRCLCLCHDQPTPVRDSADPETP
jgi:hypothetical protein